MAVTNKKTPASPQPRTHEGAKADRISAAQQLRRSIMACLLWEKEFYEDGEEIAARIERLVGLVDPREAATMAVEARTLMQLRHAPLWVVRCLAKIPAGRPWVAATLATVIQRADEMAEFLAMMGKNPKKVPHAVMKGLAKAFRKFDAYQLAKYNRKDRIVQLRDVLFLSHAKPADARQERTWTQLIDGTLPTPDTWETQLSSGKDKKQAFTDLIQSKKLGAFALIRNLRNMEQAGVDPAIVKDAIARMDARRILPFRFLAAAQAAPRYEQDLDAAMVRGLSQQPKLKGKTIIVVDVSGSMYGSRLSTKSDMDRAEAAAALASIMREVCEDVVVYATAGSDGLRKHKTAMIPARHGMALAQEIRRAAHNLGGGGIFLNQLMNYLSEQEKTADRTIVITDEQDCAIAASDAPSFANPLGAGYIINVASNRNGIGYKKWLHVDGWSDQVARFILAVENIQMAPTEDQEEDEE